MGNQDSLLVDISNNLDDIRQELRIANQLKFLELTYMAWSTGKPSGAQLKDGTRFSEEETRVYIDLRDKLAPIKEKA